MKTRARAAGDDRGQILILTALSMTVLLAVAAMSIDVSYVYDKRNRLHAAADAAAKSGAIELKRNASISNADLVAFANQQVTALGFNPAGATSVVVNHPPATGPYAGNTAYVEAIVSEPTSTFFGGILGFANMTPGGRAVAGTSNPLNCLVTMRGPGSSPYSLEIGNTSLNLTRCGVGSAGDIRGGNPNAEIVGTPLPSVTTSGACSGTCSGMGTLSTGAPPPTDPLAGLAAPTVLGACTAGVAATLNPGCYSSIASSVHNLNAGIYKVTGQLNVSSLTGTNVMIYLTGGGFITAGNNDDLHLTAPTSGTYAGIAIFQDPSDTNNFSVGNHFTLDVTGAVYMPGADVDISNHLSFVGTGCNLFVARSLNIRNGSGNMSVSGCASTFGGAAFLSISLAE